MDFHRDTAMLGATSPSHGPAPLALDDFLGRKARLKSYPYGYGSDTAAPSEEGEARSRSRSIDSQQRDEDQQQERSHSPDSMLAVQDQSEAIHGHRQEGTPAEEQATQQPDWSPNWQEERAQLGSSKKGTAKRSSSANWIRGWTAAVSEHNDEAYCACAAPSWAKEESSAASAQGGSLRDKIRGLAARTAGVSGSSSPGRRARQDTSRPVVVVGAPQASTVEAETASTTATVALSTSDDSAAPGSVCQNCGRLVPPYGSTDDGAAADLGEDSWRLARERKNWDEFAALDPASPKKKSGVFRSLLGSLTGRERRRSATGEKVSNDKGKAVDTLISATPTTAQTGNREVSATQRGNAVEPGRQHADDDADEEVDLNDLSDSSGKPRPGQGLEERQARLRRAQRMLESHNTNGATAPVKRMGGEEAVDKRASGGG